MRYFKNFKRNTVYYKTLIINFVILSVTIFLIAYTTYALSSHFLVQKTKAVASSALAAGTSSIENNYSSVNDYMISLIKDPFLKHSFSELNTESIINFNKHVFDKYPSNSVIDSVYLYYPEDNIIVTPSHTFPLSSVSPDDSSWIELIDDLPSGSINSKNFYRSVNGVNYITRIFPFPYNSDHIIGYLAVNISRDKLFGIYQVEPSDSFCAIDKNFSFTYGDNAVYDYIISNNIANISSAFEKPLTLSNVHYIFSTHFKRNGNFIYLHGIPTKNLYSQIRFMRNIIILFALIILAFAFYLYKKRISVLYSPLKNIIATYGSEDSGSDDEFTAITHMFSSVVAQKKEMETFYANSKHSVLQNLLLNLCTGNLENEKYLLDMLDSVGFPVKGRNYTVAIASLSNNSSTRLSRESIFETALPHVNIITVYLYDNKIVFLINTPKQYDAINGIVHHIQNFLKTNYDIVCSFGVGNTYDNLMKYHISFREALDALMYNTKAETVMHINDCISSGKNDKFYFSYELENRLIEAIKLANTEDALKAFDEIYSGISSSDFMPSFCSSLMWQVINMIIRAFASMGYEYSDVFGTQLIDDFALYSAITDKSKMYSFIKDKILAATGYILNSRQYSNELVVKKVLEYIDLHYTEELSLDLLSDLTTLSSKYLSKIFKATTGETITKYITDFRMEKATELLTTTDMNVNDVAEAVGYNNTRTFFRNFKVVYGLTPSEYREKNIIS